MVAAESYLATQRIERVMVALLTERFGAAPQVSVGAKHLARWPDLADATHAIMAASDIEELVDIESVG